MIRDSDREVRTYALREVRVEGDASGRRVEGHAAVFETWSQDLGGFVEKIAHGAFRKAIGRDDVRALFNHDSNLVLGRTSVGTLSLGEDQIGLRTLIHLPGTSYAEDLAISMQRGDVDQMSFAFSVGKGGDSWEKGDDLWRRTIHEVARLYDVSVVTNPAYVQTDAALRALQAARGVQTDDQDLRIRQTRQRLRVLDLERELDDERFNRQRRRARLFSA